MIDETHDPGLRSWIPSANLPGIDFPIQNLPFGSFRRQPADAPRVGVAIGDQVLDATEAFGLKSLAAVMAMPRPARVELRRRISRFLAAPSPGCEGLIIPQREVELLLPCAIGDYTDFYASLDHATNVGSMFRPGANPLLPNYKWVPIAYHGRASSIVVSGTAVRRPWGQIADTPAGPPAYAPSRRLDYEAELGAFVGPGNALGVPIPIAEAEDHLFGVCLLNDWSARDVQTWEYQPLGPFLSKSFATSISPWIVTLEALEPFRRAPQPRAGADPVPLPYLRGGDAFGIAVEVWLRAAAAADPVRVSRADFSGMYWTLAQMIAHHASNGCPLRPGDLIGSGTVSGPEKSNRGCLLEITWRGREPLSLPNGQTRAFLEDGDDVILRAHCEAPGFRRIGFGECRGTVLPAL
ncbi:MAG TPA: fumarylacetoacetase [Bryobacteraceae bacterium]|nr:fumarylacetoacetase [Bryobacteraceae bacterium]